AVAIVAIALLGAVRAPAQQVASPVIPGQKVGGSSNIKLVSHLPIRGFLQVGDIDIEQELSRPFVYISRLRLITNEAGFTVLSLKDPAKPTIVYDWRVENSAL